MNSKKKLKTYNVTYRPNESNRYKTETITYQAESAKAAEQKFYKEHPKQNKQHYLEIHSPLSNYAIDAESQKIVETTDNNNNNNNNNTSSSNSSTTTPPTPNMKKFNILNAFKLVNEYVYLLTMLIVAIIPLLLLGVVLFGDNFFLGNIVIYNIQNILDSMGGFVGIITLVLIVTVFHKFHKNN